MRNRTFSPLALILLGGCALVSTHDQELLHPGAESLPIRVLVAFHSVPSGAEVFLEGRNVGRTPVSLEVEWLPAAPPKRLEMALEGYERATRLFNPGDSEVRLELQEQVSEISLELKANPPGTLVQVDAEKPRPIGKEIELSWSLTRREHVLSFTHPGYASKRIKVTLETNKRPLDVRLTPLFAEDR